MEKDKHDGEASVNTRKRGWLLSTFLILAFIANPVTAYMYFNHPEIIAGDSIKANDGISIFFGFMCIINVIVASAIWAWRKIGVYSLYLVVLLTFFINLFLGVSLASSLTGLVGAVIVYFTTRPRWQYFT